MTSTSTDDTTSTSIDGTTSMSTDGRTSMSIDGTTSTSTDGTTSTSIDGTNSETIDSTSASINTDFCHRLIPLEIPERSSCFQDIADSTLKSIDISSFDQGRAEEADVNFISGIGFQGSGNQGGNKNSYGNRGNFNQSSQHQKPYSNN
ncbi:hypothetical protein F2Q70_00038436 [Brassica cretica]|nr:hypothetical protein F2Q70_00038436 [Brassica cretica]